MFACSVVEPKEKAKGFASSVCSKVLLVALPFVFVVSLGMLFSFVFSDTAAKGDTKSKVEEGTALLEDTESFISEAFGPVGGTSFSVSFCFTAS